MKEKTNIELHLENAIHDICDSNEKTIRLLNAIKNYVAFVVESEIENLKI